MQIVIDIPEEEYKLIKYNTAECIAEQVIKNGTPLPKGHGRLIDADALLESPMKYFGFRDIDINNAPTIVEADKENAE